MRDTVVCALQFTSSYSKKSSINQVFAPSIILLSSLHCISQPVLSMLRALSVMRYSRVCVCVLLLLSRRKGLDLGLYYAPHTTKSF